MKKIQTSSDLVLCSATRKMNPYHSTVNDKVDKNDHGFLASKVQHYYYDFLKNKHGEYTAGKRGQIDRDYTEKHMYCMKKIILAVLDTTTWDE